MYYNARYYVPGLGRFASADTIVPDPTNPQQYNRYSYVLNSPLNFKDPSGHCIVGYSGDVRMDQYPYGTGGVCPYTEHWETEASHARQEMYYSESTRPSPDGTSLFVSVDPTQTPAINGTAGLEGLYNHKTEEITIFAVAGGAVTLGGGVSGRIMVNSVYNIGDDNLNYAGLFVFFNVLVSNGLGLTGGSAYTPLQGEGGILDYWGRDENRAYSQGFGGAIGVGTSLSGGPVEYIPLFTIAPGGGFTPHAGWYLFENDQQWWLSEQFSEIVQWLAQYAGFDPENYNWDGGG